MNESKQITDEINKKLEKAKDIEERIEETRKHYYTVAQHATKLYFCIEQMAALDPMYQFSMKWFRENYVKSFSYSERIKDSKGRIK